MLLYKNLYIKRKLSFWNNIFYRREWLMLQKKEENVHIAKIEERIINVKEKFRHELSWISEEINFQDKIEIYKIVFQEIQKTIVEANNSKLWNYYFQPVWRFIFTNVDSLNVELSKCDSKELETVTRFFDLLKDNNLIYKKEEKRHIKTSISELEWLLSARRQEKQLWRAL